MEHHPFAPADLELPGYIPISLDQSTILAVFFCGGALCFLLLILLARGSRLSVGETLVICWLGLSGLTHIVVEGPVVFNAKFYMEDSESQYMHFMSDLWKEYGKADSRYLLRDACTIGIEGITACVEGPLCFLCILGYLWRRSWRQLLALLIVTGELYGTVLYFYTSAHEGFIYQRKEPTYWWFYFWFMNSLWILFPCLFINYLGGQLCKAVQFTEENDASR